MMQARSLTSRTPSRDALIVLSITLAALAFRLSYMATSVVEHEIVGDIFAYASYAKNLFFHGIYSSQPFHLGAVPTEADSFRPPGYPLFLAFCMWICGGRDWILTAKLLQIFASAGTVYLSMSLARRWLGTAWVAACGLVVGFWPHEVVFASTLLSETVYGFLVILSIRLLVAARENVSPIMAGLAGLSLGVAGMFNPVILPMVVPCLYVLRGAARRRLLAPFIIAFATLPIAWQATQLDVPTREMPGRATMNLIQGAWPEYHHAWKALESDSTARATMAHIDADIQAADAGPEVLAKVLERHLAATPIRSLKWYLIQKPYLLWDWDIRLGAGDIYFLAPVKDAYAGQPIPRLTLQLLRALNPALFAFALAGVLLNARSWLMKRPTPLPLALSCVLIVCVTLVHSVFQAEPRYSIPYKPFEILVAITTLQAVVSRAMHRMDRPTRAVSPTRPC